MDNYLMKTLDEMEARTEKLRTLVREAERERDNLLESLNILMQSEALCSAPTADRQELELYSDRLVSRLLTIEITVQTVRSPSQEQSLETVHSLLTKVNQRLSQGGAEYSTIHQYLNSCLEEPEGPVDDRFQEALLGCAAEDQKKVKKMLVSLWEAKEDTRRQAEILSATGFK